MKRVAVATLLTLACLAAAACRRDAPPSANAPGRAGAADRQQIENGVRDAVAKVLGLEPGEVDVAAPLSKQKVPADELDTVEIVMEVEEAFGVEIPDADISGPDGGVRADLSVRKLAEIVAAKKGVR